jgi:hypothetical protein
MSKTPVEMEPNIWALDVDRLKDLDYAERAIKFLFSHISGNHGPFVARGFLICTRLLLRPEKTSFPTT